MPGGGACKTPKRAYLTCPNLRIWAGGDVTGLPHGYAYEEFHCQGLEHDGKPNHAPCVPAVGVPGDTNTTCERLGNLLGLTEFLV